MVWAFALLPVVGALIGWVTNAIAVRMLFHPKTPVRIPLTGLSLQGVLPRRHADLAATVGRTVAEELLPADAILDRIDLTTMKEGLLRTVADHVEERLHSGLPGLLPNNLRQTLAGYVRRLVARETDTVLDAVFVEFQRSAASYIDVAAIVTEKIAELDLDELEQLAYRMADKELRAIVVLGAVLGFVIGLLQMVVMLVLLPG